MSTVVAYLGPQGTFTEAALLAFQRQGCFSGDVDALPVSSPAEAISALSGAADFAVVAIENSVDGPVTPTFDALASDANTQIYRETDLEVAFSIMRRSDSGAVTLATHPVAWQQVKGWVAEHLPGVRFVPASSNADAARMVSEGQADYAAAPARAAELYGLEEVATGVADMKGARTRFVLVGKRGLPTKRTGNDRTSVAFTLPNVPGSLVRALNEFAVRGVDLSRIESRPTRTDFGTYRFYADLAGHIDDIPVGEALRALYLGVEDIHYLGSWPACTEKPGNTGSDDMLARIHAADIFIQQLRTGEH
ncbi:prephenate dehydratase [Corynebacterium sp. H127]|uniref:prephenate dehydratase n=1 Tax=Corynebacterium sp. H127 TaxID=3133418 RepID=UPI0030B32439